VYTKETYLYTQEPKVYTIRKKPTKETHARGLTKNPKDTNADTMAVDTKETYLYTKKTYQRDLKKRSIIKP